MKNRAGEKVVTLVVQNYESFAALDVDCFFAMQMSASMPPDSNFGSHQAAAARRKAELRRDHQGSLVILRCSHPFEIFGARDSRGLIDRFLIVFGPF